VVVVGDSELFWKVKSLNTLWPRFAPRRCLSSLRISPSIASAPPPRSNPWLISAATETESAGVHGAGVLPVAAYSAGISAGLDLSAAIRALIPAV
jgi:hypothetical protein